ncbi:MAG TPA: hypothetical protein VGS62_04710, partial [Streptosporangiaceae bacterium]|nr:hypothetical protein [Streptosporangiaceae bacterium]
YGIADAAAFAAIGLLLWGPQPERRRRRAAWWRLAGTVAIAVPAASYLASVVSWWLLPHPAIWLYGLTAAWTALIGAVALAGPWRRAPLAPLGLVAAVTAAVIAVDVATGSRLQMGTPFGLSAIGVVGGRFYGIGNNAVVIYAAAGIFAAAWLGMMVLRQGGRRTVGAAPADGTGRPGTGQPGTNQPGTNQPGRATRRLALLTAGTVALVLVVVSGWPGFGAKVGGTFAMVPGFLIVLMGLAGVRITARRAIAAMLAGVALVVAFALVNYIVPATGHSDIGGFAGQVLHGGAASTLSRKIDSNVGSLTVGYYALIVPPVVVLAGLILLRPSWFAVRTLPRAWTARPLLRVTLAAIWLVAVLSWVAEDSGVTVVASALPFALPLAIAACAAAACLDPERPVAAAERSVRQAILDLPP